MQRVGGADQLVHGFAFDTEGDECSRHQRLAQRPLDDSGKQLTRCRSIEVLAIEKASNRVLCIGVVNRRSGSDFAWKSQNLAHEIYLKQKSPPVAGGQSMIGWLVDQSRHRAA
ncbi:MAG: hypothetical protein ACM3IG_05645 [Myxococcales bacterium]